MGAATSLHLHRLPECQLAERRVSVQSLWHDGAWVFDPEYPSQPLAKRKVIWPKGIAPTFIDAAKRLVWSLRVDPPQGHVRHKNASSAQLANRLFLLLRWMGEPLNGYGSLAEIDRAAAENYRNDVAARHQGRDGRGASAKVLCQYLEPIVLSFRQRGKLPDSVQAEPYGGLGAFEAARPISTQEPGWIPYIPDDIAAPVLAQLVEWVDHRSTDIIALERERRAIADRWPANERFNHPRERKAAYRDLRSRFTFSVAPGGADPWHPKLKSLTEVGTLVAALRHACGSLILATTGIRVHELLSLDQDCVTVEPSADGLFEIFYLKGVTAKLERGAREVRWTAGARPLGSTAVPEPVRAVRVLVDLYRDHRATSGQSALFLASDHRFTTAKGARRISDSSFTKHYDGFYQRWIDSPRPWRFTTHQWRKTFARFVLRNDRTALSALSGHYQHVSIAMTDRGYLGASWRAWDLTEYVDDIAKADTAEALMSMIDSNQALGGRMGERIEAMRPRFRGMLASERADEIAWIIDDGDLTIHACDWGWCVYREETSRCEGGPKAPSHARRNPSACASCANLAVGQCHRPYWESRRDRNAELLARLSEASSLRRAVVRERIEESERILSRMDHDGPTADA